MFGKRYVLTFEEPADEEIDDANDCVCERAAEQSRRDRFNKRRKIREKNSKTTI